MTELSEGEKVCRFIERYCHVPEGALVGSTIELAPFQREFIKAVYDNPAGTRRGYLSMARKNAKTTTIACLLLAHLVGPQAQPNSQIVSGARSRDQAALVFDLACKIIRQSPDLEQIIRIIPSSKKLYGLPRNVEFKALAAEGKTAHGLSPVLAILDEVGQVQGSQDDFVDAIVTSQGAHDAPLLLAISTQAPTDNDLFSQWLDDAAASEDQRIVSHVYAADPNADVLDEEGWQSANPALGIFRSYEDLKEQAERASRMPDAENSFRNLCLNQRVTGVKSFVSLSVWDQNGETPDEMDGVTVWGGLDLSGKTDLTSAVFVWQSDGVWHVAPYFWTPSEGLRDRAKRDRVPYERWVEYGYLRTTPGATVDYGYIAEELAEILGDVEVASIAYDRWRMDIMQRELDQRGISFPLSPFGQGYKDMSPALDALESELLNGRIAHGMHPVLRMCALNAVGTQDPAGNRKLDKHKANGRIDGMVALAMALGVAQTEVPEGPSVYETRGVLTL